MPAFSAEFSPVDEYGITALYRRPVAIDLFAGAGGFSLGMEQAGFDVVVAVEQDPVHAAVYGFNFPHAEVLCTDVCTLSSQTLQEAAARGWAAHQRQGKVSSPWNGEIDVVIGGPPCQGFSVMGKRRLDDDRNHLVFHFCRLVAELQPRYFVMENVPGLGQGKHATILKRLQRQFKQAGYRLTRKVKVLNAADFGVPQNRKRLFLLGTRDGEAPLEYPDPEAALMHKPITVRDAIADLPNLEDFPELKQTDEVWLTPAQLYSYETSASPYAKKLRGLSDHQNLAYPRSWNPQLLTSSRQTQHSAIAHERFLQTPMGQLELISRLRRLDWEKCCHTLRAGTGAERGSYTSPRPIHPHYPRVISVREAARLHSFPDWFRFHATKWHGFRQVGNAVPPLLAQALGRQIVRTLEIVPPLPKQPIKLGDTQLLRFKALEAAKYWRQGDGVMG